MTSAAEERPPRPSGSGSARGLFIHKKKRLREERVSQNQSRRHGPHRAASPGHVPRLRGTGTELRGRRCVRRPGAAPGDRPAGERNPTPSVPRWTAPETVRAAPAQSGPGPGTAGGSGARRGGSGSCPFSVVQGLFSPHSPVGRARRGGNEDLRTSPLWLALFPPLSAVSPSLRLCYRLSFLLSTADFFVPSASEGDPLSGMSSSPGRIKEN